MNITTNCWSGVVCVFSVSQQRRHYIAWVLADRKLFLPQEVYLYGHTGCLVQINPIVVSLLRNEERFFQLLKSYQRRKIQTVFVVLKVGVFSCGLPVILPVIAENVIVLWHNCLVVPNRGVGGKGRGNICGPPGGRFQREAKLAAKRVLQVQNSELNKFLNY